MYSLLSLESSHVHCVIRCTHLPLHTPTLPQTITNANNNPVHSAPASTGCVVVNTWADKNVDRLLVKLDNFGLARVYQHPLEYGLGEASGVLVVLVLEVLVVSLVMVFVFVVTVFVLRRCCSLCGCECDESCTCRELASPSPFACCLCVFVLSTPCRPTQPSTADTGG